MSSPTHNKQKKQQYKVAKKKLKPKKTKISSFLKKQEKGMFENELFIIEDSAAATITTTTDVKKIVAIPKKEKGGKKPAPVVVILKRRKICRRKPGTKSAGNYFGMSTQEAIATYQNEKNVEQKKKIFVDDILPAFDSLVENLINVYGFKVMYESKKDLKGECLEFLYTTVDKFDTTRNSKAFSYFNVVAKNWLTIKSKQNVKKMKTYISSDNKEVFTNADLERYESHNTVPSYEQIIEQQEVGKMLKDIMHELEKKVRTENEIICVKAINQIIDNLEDIDILNKRAVLLYLRELTSLSPKQMSLVLSSLKRYYREIRKQEKFNY